WARPPDGLFSAREEAALDEGLALAEQVVHGPPQARGQRPQRPLLAVLLLAAVQPRPGPFAGPQQQAGRLGEGPFPMGVADLVAPGSLLLPGRFVCAPHQPGGGPGLPLLSDAV